MSDRRCVVEWRSERWHVTLPDVGLELAPVFDNWVTAAEIAGKYQDGHAFCSDIPCLTIGTPFPRPNRLQPARTIDLERFRPETDEGIQRRARELPL